MSNAADEKGLNWFFKDSFNPSPPFLILFAEKDGKGFDQMASELNDSLKKNGVASTVHEMKDRTHGAIVSNIPNPGDPTARLMLEFMRRLAR